MKLCVVSVPRRPSWPLWAVAVVVGWAALMGLSLYLADATGYHRSFCAFKQLTGIPCPTCGLTRGAIRMLRGDLPGAWAQNPLALTVVALLAAETLFRLALGRTIRAELTNTERRGAWTAGIAAFLANWAYVIARFR